MEIAGEGYRAARIALFKVIKQAKSEFWDDLLHSFNKNPWRRPYRMVLCKFRPWAPSLTEKLDPPFFAEVIQHSLPASKNNAKILSGP